VTLARYFVAASIYIGWVVLLGYLYWRLSGRPYRELPRGWKR
jgi:hypothetical protein